MSLRFIDGFDHYGTSNDILLKWSVPPTLVYPTVAQSPRIAGYSILGGYRSSMGKLLDNQQIWIIGVGIKFTGTNSGSSIDYIYSWHDGTISDTTVQSQIGVDTDGYVKVYRGLRNTLLGTSSIALPYNIWSYLEWKVTHAGGTSGSTSLKINGVSVLTVTGVSTILTSNAYASCLCFGSWENTNSFQGYLDDLYVCDGTGTLNNDYLGDMRVEYLPPNAGGTTTNLSIGGSAGSNWGSVKELAEDGDTTYVYSSTVGNEDTYNVTDLSNTPQTIAGIQTIMLVRKDDAGSRTASRVIRSGGTDYAGTSVGLGNSYQYFTDILQQDPATSAAWTQAGVNALEAGVRVTG